MATDEEIERFVTENRELVERLMASQKDKVEAAKEAGRDVARFGAISTYYAAEYARKKSEEFSKNQMGAVVNECLEGEGDGVREDAQGDKGR